jgi:stalled ribosome rescue protein Dom34
MSAYTVWIDSREAKVFKMAAGGLETLHIHAHGAKHHSEPHGKHAGHHDAEALYKDTAKALADASEILILGPGEAKGHFKTHLEKHFGGTLAKKVVGVEAMDHPTDNQIVAQARKFFKSYDLFNG